MKVLTAIATTLVVYAIGILLCGMFCCSSCGRTKEETPIPVQWETVEVETPYGKVILYVYEIRGCEYYGTKSLNSNYATLTHAGDCKACLKRYYNTLY